MRLFCLKPFQSGNRPLSDIRQIWYTSKSLSTHATAQPQKRSADAFWTHVALFNIQAFPCRNREGVRLVLTLDARAPVVGDAVCGPSENPTRGSGSNRLTASQSVWGALTTNNSSPVWKRPADWVFNWVALSQPVFAMCIPLRWGKPRAHKAALLQRMERCLPDVHHLI